MPSHPDPEVTLEAFLKGLQRLATPERWTVIRVPDGVSERGFLVMNGKQTLHLIAKVSHSEKGFWGLTEAQATKISTTNDLALVLLTGPYAGYFIPGAKFKALLPSLSRTAAGAIRINEGKVLPQERFNTLIRLWPLLKAAAVA